MASYDLRIVMEEWKRRCGETRISRLGVKYTVVPKERRKEMIRNLVLTLKIKGGKELEFFRSKIFTELLLETCIGPTVDRALKHSIGAVIMRELTEVLTDMFPSGVFKD